MISNGKSRSLRSNATREEALRNRTPEQAAKSAARKAARLAREEAKVQATMEIIRAERAAKAAQA
jgi:hypothetical protein